MAVFPTTFPIPKISNANSCGDSFKMSVKDSTISSTTDAGYKLTRARTTKMIQSWTFAWVAVPWERYKELLDFFYQVGTFERFTFTNWIDGKEYTVRFAEALTDWQEVYPYGWKGKLTFEEV